MESESFKKALKKAAKKAVAKSEIVRRREEAAASIGVAGFDEEDKLATNYGEISFEDLQSTVITSRKWTKIGSLSEEMIGQSVLIRGHAQLINRLGNKMAFVVVREKGFTVQCMVTFVENVVSERMMKFASSLSRESMVDVEGVVSCPKKTVKRATQHVEIHVRKLLCVNKAVCTLPFLIEDVARSEVDIENSLETGEQLVHVNQDTRLKFKTLDLRTPLIKLFFVFKMQLKQLQGCVC